MTTTGPGSFIWYDLLTHDTNTAAEFYGHVVGWKASPMGAEYTLFANAHGGLAGTTKGERPHWTANVQVADVDAAVAEVKRFGGTVIADAADYPNVGRLAVIADPQGATMNLYAPAHPQTVRDPLEPGEFCWSELMSTDHEAAFVFYVAIFGWKKSRDLDMGAMGKYLIFNAGGRDLGGMMTKPQEGPGSSWAYYIQLRDLDAAIARAKELGGKVLSGPMSFPGGARIAQLLDPTGAMFALHEEPNQ